MRRACTAAAATAAAGLIVYPALLVHADRGMIILGCVAAVALAVALARPTVPFALGCFCTLWCAEYGLGLFAGHLRIDPLAPLMGAGLFLVVSLVDLVEAAARGAVFSEGALRHRLLVTGGIACGSVALGAAALAAGGLVAGGGVLALVLAAALASAALALPAAARGWAAGPRG
jgi:hypothetical protein